MDLKEKIKLDFNRHAYHYDEYANLQRQVADKLFSLTLSYINDNTILDLGCGTGYIHELFRKNNYINQIVQVDIAINMCKIAKEYSDLTDTITVNGDIEKTFFRTNSFNIIISSLALQWTDYKISLENIYNLLSPNGYCFFAIFGPSTLHELDYCFQKLDNSKRINKFPTQPEIIDYMDNAGFKDINIQTHQIRHYYKNMNDIMRGLKSLGASYKAANSMLSRQKIISLEEIYRNNFIMKDGLPITWEILLVKGKK